MKALEVKKKPLVAILAYHSIDDTGSVLSTSPRIFAEQMRTLSELDADIVDIKEVGRRKNRGIDNPMIALTFDDGFSNVHEHAFPVLQRYGFPATVFVVTDYCGEMNSWPSQPSKIPHQSLLSWEQIREMSRYGIDFGSHTRTHPDLATISTHEVVEELLGSKKAIEDALGVPADTFAYPYGSYRDWVKELIRGHFSLACSTTLGFVRPESDCFALERLDMFYLRRLNLLRHLFSPVAGSYIWLRRSMRALRGHVPAFALER